MARSHAPLVCMLISAGSLLCVPVTHGQSIASDAALFSKHLRIRRTIIEAPNGASTSATDVNNAGVVVGSYNAPESRAFAWTRSAGFVDLEGATAVFSQALAVNECGQVVGDLGGNAVRWNTFDEVELLARSGAAADVNDRGDVVGFSQVDAGNGRGGPFLWTEEEGLRPIVECEGTATGVNNAQEVIGTCEAGGQRQAFFWSASTGRIDFLGFLTSHPFAINDRGEVAVFAATLDATSVAAFKWMPRRHRVVPLRDLGDDFSRALAINKVGWIVGDAVDANDTRRAVIWLTPKRGFKVDPSLGASSVATGLNDLGSIVGTVDFSDPSAPGPRDLRAVLWEPPAIVSHVLSKRGAGRCLRSAP